MGKVISLLLAAAVLLGLSTTGHAQTPQITDGLVYWNLWNNTANDQSGQLNHFNLIGSPGYINGGTAGATKCLLLNGSSQCARINDSAALSSTGEMTVVWAGIPLAKSGTTAAISKDKFNASGNRSWGLLVNGGSDRFQFEQFSGATGTTATANNHGSIVLNEPVIVIATRASNGTISISVNGGTPDTTTGTGATNDSTTEVSVGSRMSDDSTRTSFFNGLVRATGLWSRCLTLAEQTAIVNKLQSSDTFQFVDPLITTFKTQKRQATCHFGALTYASYDDYELGTPDTVPASLFDPDNYDHWQSYFDACEKLGIDSVWVTSKHWNGFCLWPSRVNDYNVTASPFYARTGIDVFRDFCRAARQRGIVVNLYYCVQCQKYQTDDDLQNAYTIEQYTLAMLTELMGGEYGEFGYVLLDGWGSFWEGELGGVSFTDVDYQTVYDHVKAMQPNCLIAVNNHDADALTVYGEMRLFEYPVEGAATALFYPFPAATSHYAMDKVGADLSARWFQHPDSPANTDRDANTFIGLAFLDAKHGYPSTFNVGLGPDGTLPDGTNEMLDELRDKARTTVLTDSFAEATSTPLQTHDATWSKISTGANIQIDPTGQAWPNNDYCTYEKTDSGTTGNCYQEIIVTFPSTMNFQIFLENHKSSSTDSMRFYWTQSSGVVTCEMYRLNTTLTQLSAFTWSTAIVTDTPYKMAFWREDDGEWRGQVSEYIGGEFVAVGRLMVTNTETTGGTMGLAMSANASSTTGPHMLQWSTKTDITEAPDEGDGSLAFDDQTITISKPSDATYAKLERSANGGVGWIPVAYFRTADFDGNALSFTDTEVENVNDYWYRIKFGNTAFLESDWSTVRGANVEITVPTAQRWKIKRIDGLLKAVAAVPKDVGEDDMPVYVDFSDVLADGDSILDEDDGGIESIELIDDSDEGDDIVLGTTAAEVLNHEGIEFKVSGGTAGNTDRIRVKARTANGQLLSAPCSVKVTDAGAP